jgi:hypothetical protein
MEIPRADFGLGCGAAFLEKRDAACSAFEGTQIRQYAKSLRSSDQLHGLSTAWAPRQYSREIFGTHGEARFSKRRPGAALAA